ncbi:MAG: DUF177 domain-containing protein [Bdellovibrionales bacterium]
MKQRSAPGGPELSRPLYIEKISPNGVEEIIVAGEKERAGLARRFGLTGLPKLEAQLTVMPARAVMFEVKGRMQADVVQQCVVTLEPLPAHIEQDIDVLFAPSEFLEPGAGAAHVDADDEETEAIIGGIIDLGELVAQYLGTALDPYPRKPGLAFVAAEYGDKRPDSPFTKLTDLTKKPPDKG